MERLAGFLDIFGGKRDERSQTEKRGEEEKKKRSGFRVRGKSFTVLISFYTQKSKTAEKYQIYETRKATGRLGAFD
jgi:hypothetical protein